MSGPQGDASQRRDKRVSVRLGCEIETHDDLFTAYTKDLSAGGSALVCERPLEDGATVRVALFLVYDGIEDERTPPLVVGAKVQWTVETDEGAHNAGIRFEGMSEAQAAWLGKVIAASAA